MIQDFMMFQCISSFEIKDERLYDTVLTQKENEKANEHRETQLSEHTLDSISDSEEDDSCSIQTALIVQTCTQQTLYTVIKPVCIRQEITQQNS